jgi:hypothetical protein
MGKFVLLQAFYCITGCLFFVRDLYNKVPMDKGIVNAFIWPYAQWPVMKMYALEMLEPVILTVQNFTN